jgi:hypothetical protein
MLNFHLGQVGVIWVFTYRPGTVEIVPACDAISPPVARAEIFCKLPGRTNKTKKGKSCFRNSREKRNAKYHGSFG